MRHQETRTVAGQEIDFFTVPVGSGRWVFSGCGSVGGYATIEDALVVAEAQLTGKIQGRLAATAGHRVAKRDHERYYREHISPLDSKGW